MRRFLILLLAGVAALLAGAAAFVAADPELRGQALLAISPKAFRDAEFQRLAGPSGQTLYLLGSIHGGHPPDYGLVHLRAVITRLRPDLLLVESRPQEMARGNLGDGPIEALYETLVGRAAGIEVAGIDWWTMNAAHEIDSDAREDHMAANVRAALAGRRTVLVIVGYSHLQPLADRLAAGGYHAAPFAEAEKERLFDSAGLDGAWPVGMATYVQRRIEADQATLRGVTDPFWRQRLADAIAARAALLRTIAPAAER
jgi:hypothetical protein